MALNPTSGHRASYEGISPRRQAFNRMLQRGILCAFRFGTDHWLLIVNTVAAIVFALPTLGVPLLRAAGLELPADIIYGVYGFTCHQMPSRSFSLFGEQMALCHRMSAIHGAFLAFGLLYIPFRRRMKCLPAWLAAAYSLPMAADGFTQLFGWRESTWELRLLTGSFFGLAVVWYTFPHFELLLGILNRQLRSELNASEG